MERRAALGWFSFTTLIFWLVTIRGAFDGPSYEWGLFGLGGRGMQGDYWFPLIGVLGALVVLAGGWRSQIWAFVIITAWNILLLAGAIAFATKNPAGFRFRGDTLGIDVSLAWIGPMLFGAGTLLSVAAIRRVHQSRNALPFAWQAHNWRWLIVLASALPIQFCLLRFGGVDSLSDQIGVVITIVQWFLIGRVLRPYRP